MWGGSLCDGRALRGLRGGGRFGSKRRDQCRPNRARRVGAFGRRVRCATESTVFAGVVEAGAEVVEELLPNLVVILVVGWRVAAGGSWSSSGVFPLWWGLPICGCSLVRPARLVARVVGFSSPLVPRFAAARTAPVVPPSANLLAHGESAGACERATVTDFVRRESRSVSGVIRGGTERGTSGAET